MRRIAEIRSARTTRAAVAAVALLATAATAEAAVVALVDDRTLVLIDPETRNAASPVAVQGVDGALLGIDVRPADSKLYGLFADGTLAVIDPKTGAATAGARLATLPAAGSTVTVDFNPVADRLRVIGSDGSNLRIKVDDGAVVEDGKLKFAAGDMHAGETPMIAAGAYTNSAAGAKETALYDIDTTIDALVKQAPPNDGVLAAVGKLGMPVEVVAFDIAADGKGGNAAWMMANGTLYSVDLATGKATAAGTVSGIEGDVRDIAILP